MMTFPLCATFSPFFIVNILSELVKINCNLLMSSIFLSTGNEEEERRRTGSIAV